MNLWLHALFLIRIPVSYTHLVEAAYTVETDIDKLCDKMIERIEEKRTAIGI